MSPVGVSQRLGNRFTLLTSGARFEGRPLQPRDVVYLSEYHHDGLAVVLTTHDLNGIAAHLPRLVCLNREVIATGRPQDVITPEVLERTYDGLHRALKVEVVRTAQNLEGTGQGVEGHPLFGRAQRVINVIDARQSYLQKIVRAGLQALGHTAEAERSVHFAYEMVALSPATAKLLGYVTEGEEERSLEMSGRKGIGVKADDLMDQLFAKSPPAGERAYHALHSTGHTMPGFMFLPSGRHPASRPQLRLTGGTGTGPGSRNQNME